jgi:hypothetical protein
MLGLGDTIILPKPGLEKEHLWVLVTAPDSNGTVIMVNLTTQRPHSDTTVILQPGEHPFIDRPTVVFYADARFVEAALLESCVSKGIGRNHSQIEKAVLQKIQNGLLISPLTPQKIKTAFLSAKSEGRI